MRLDTAIASLQGMIYDKEALGTKTRRLPRLQVRMTKWSADLHFFRVCVCISKFVVQRTSAKGKPTTHHRFASETSMSVATRDTMSDRMSTYDLEEMGELTPAEQQKQSKRIQESLDFLNRIKTVKVTGTTQEDGKDYLVFDVIMKEEPFGQHSQLSEKESKKFAKKESKKTRPKTSYQTSKAFKTAKLMHEAIYHWSIEHPDGAASSCVYCRQFNSPAARALWSERTRHSAVNNGNAAALTVVVNNSELRQYEVCLNSYLESARTVPPEGLDARECQGFAHIPSIVASFLQRALITSKTWSRTGFMCGHM